MLLGLRHIGLGGQANVANPRTVMCNKREKYMRLRPFIHHGSPGIKNLKEAQRRGYRLANFPIYDFIHHEGRGTCSRYGYNLGIKHTLEYLLRNALRRIYPGTPRDKPL